MNEKIITEESIHVCLVKQFKNEKIADETRSYSKWRPPFLFFLRATYSSYTCKPLCILSFHFSLKNIYDFYKMAIT